MAKNRLNLLLTDTNEKRNVKELNTECVIEESLKSISISVRMYMSRVNGQCHRTDLILRERTPATD